MAAQDRFVNACGEGNLERVKTIWARGDVGVDRKCYLGGTALCAACYHGHLHIVRWLIEDLHADPNAPEYLGYTPFSRAISRRLAVAQYMLAHGADPRAENSDGETPFWIACCIDKVRMVQWLALTVGVGDDAARASRGGDRYGGTSPLQICHTNRKLVTWLRTFLRRRVLVALWGTGRTRRRQRMPALGDTVEAAVWTRLPREALASVLLMLAPPPV